MDFPRYVTNSYALRTSFKTSVQWYTTSTISTPGNTTISITMTSMTPNMTSMTPNMTLLAGNMTGKNINLTSNVTVHDDDSNDDDDDDDDMGPSQKMKNSANNSNSVKIVNKDPKMSQSILSITVTALKSVTNNKMTITTVKQPLATIKPLQITTKTVTTTPWKLQTFKTLG